MGVRPAERLFTVVLVDIWVYTPFIMSCCWPGCVGSPAAAFRGRRARRRADTFVFFRIMLPMLLPYIMTAALFRMLDSIQQFDIIYRHDAGRARATRCMVFQVQAYTLAFYQYHQRRPGFGDSL